MPQYESRPRTSNSSWGGRTRTSNFPVNSRACCQLTYNPELSSRTEETNAPGTAVVPGARINLPEMLRRPAPRIRAPVAIREQNGERPHAAYGTTALCGGQGDPMTTIAAATPADLPALLELLGQSALPTAGLADHVDTTFVARDAGRVVGSAALELYGTAALLRSVAGAPELRRHRLGPGVTRHPPALARPRHTRTGVPLTETAGGVFPRFR